MNRKFVKTVKQDEVFIVTLDRPEKKNALSRQMREELSEILADFEYNKDLRVLIITNSGDCFCAGSDLKEINEGTYESKEKNLDGFGIVTGRYISKPIIAAIHGLCLGGGAEMLLASDLAVVSHDCKISFPEIRQGLLAAGGGGLLRLGRSIPVKLAMELAITGDPVDAQTALSWGLVNRVVDSDKVLSESIELAKRILVNSPVAVKRSKYLLYRSMNKSWLRDSDGWMAMMQADEDIKQTTDAKEGVRAFTEKRSLVWSDC